jgi:hypothetical protein
MRQGGVKPVRKPAGWLIGANEPDAFEGAPSEGALAKVVSSHYILC